MAGLIAIAFAAAYPERVSGLVLVNTAACLARASEDVDAASRRALEMALYGAHLDEYAPSMDALLEHQLLRLCRLSASPRIVSEIHAILYALDLRDVLSAIQAPTLVAHRTANRVVPVEDGRYLAGHIAGARLLELPGDVHINYVDADALLDEIDHFVTGERREVTPDRVLATVLFVDLVASTETAVALGDHRWRGLLDRYEETVTLALDRFRGRLVKSTGDGTLATFDGPGRALKCATAIRDAVERAEFAVRIGLHTGEVEMRGGDVAGIAVHIAQRVQAQAQPNEVLVSRTVVDLVAGSGLAFDDREEHELKGVPGRWRLFAVAG
jgi:class 3 adenylate cyclase